MNFKIPMTILTILSTTTAMAVEKVGNLAAVQGTVLVDGKPGANGMALLPSSSIQTKNGTCTLLFGSDVVIHLDKNSLFSVENYKAQSGKTEMGVKLQFGRLRALAANKKDSAKDIKIKTRTAVMGIRGTHIYIDSPQNPQMPENFLTIEGKAEVTMSNPPPTQDKQGPEQRLADNKEGGTRAAEGDKKETTDKKSQGETKEGTKTAKNEEGGSGKQGEAGKEEKGPRGREMAREDGGSNRPQNKEGTGPREGSQGGDMAKGGPREGSQGGDMGRGRPQEGQSPAGDMAKGGPQPGPASNSSGPSGDMPRGGFGGTGMGPGSGGDMAKGGPQGGPNMGGNFSGGMNQGPGGMMRGPASSTVVLTANQMFAGSGEMRSIDSRMANNLANSVAPPPPPIQNMNDIGMIRNTQGPTQGGGQYAGNQPPPGMGPKEGQGSREGQGGQGQGQGPRDGQQGPGYGQGNGPRDGQGPTFGQGPGSGMRSGDDFFNGQQPPMTAPPPIRLDPVADGSTMVPISITFKK